HCKFFELRWDCRRLIRWRPMKPAAREPIERLNLSKSPVAVAFLDSPPTDLQRVDRPAPAGCSYWKMASEGSSFYTTDEDHQNCPVGAFTHGVSLPPGKSEELQDLVGTMI